VKVGVNVGVLLGVSVEVAVGVNVGVLLGVSVNVAVGVNVGVLLGVSVNVAVGVNVGVLLGVSVKVGVYVGVLLGVCLVRNACYAFPPTSVHYHPRALSPPTPNRGIICAYGEALYVGG
jgi:hypothetical protein